MRFFNKSADSDATTGAGFPTAPKWRLREAVSGNTFLLLIQ